MTVYDYIIELNEEEMVNFLYHFACDIVDKLEKFSTPNKEAIRKLLEAEI